MDDIRLAPVAAYNSQLEADLAAARLNEAGIKGYVRSDGLAGTFPGMPMATGGFQVMVAESDQEVGRAVILEMGSQAADRSTGDLDNRSWKALQWIIPAAALALVLLALVPKLI